MTKPLYRIILSEAWRSTWTHKRLWFWGLFAGLLGNAGEYQLLLTAIDRTGAGEVVPGGAPGLFQTPPLTSQTTAGLWQAFTADAAATFVLLLIGLSIIAAAVFFVWLTMVSVVALVRSGTALAHGRRTLTLSEGTAEGQRHFGPVLVLYVFGRLVLWLLLALLVLFGALAARDFLVGFPLFLVSFLLFLPALFVVSFVVRYAVMFVVLRERSILEALDAAATLFRTNWLVTAELAFFLFAINIVVGAGLALLVGGFVFPIHLAALTMANLSLVAWAIALELLAALLFLALLFGVGSALGTFQWLAWTLLFDRLQEKGATSKLVRVLGRLVGNRPVRVTSL
jgi:hypothetical protein